MSPDDPNNQDTLPTLDPEDPRERVTRVDGEPSPPTRPETAGRKRDPVQGRTLGPYEILGEIGRGGMGVVYRAFHPGLKRTVALKVMIAGEDATEDAIARFHREAESVAKLGHHPNIVPVYDIGTDGARHYFAMHCVEGEPLDRLIASEVLTPRQAAWIAMKVADALEHAHAHGVLHRDIKPANILLARSGEESPGPRARSAGAGAGPQTRNEKPETLIGEPMLTDFGLAKDVQAGSSMTRSGVTLGTPQYMPPEQADGRIQDIDARSDVYALGATLYEMLVMRPPFEGSSAVHVIKQVILDDPAPPRGENPAVDRDLETICLKCLEKDRARRYPTAGELAADLGRYLDGQGILAKPVSVWEKFNRRVKRHKAAYAALAVALLALLAGAVSTWLVVLGGERKAEEARVAATDAETRQHEAEEARRKAEKNREKTARLLEKSRAVTRVLLNAHAKLGRVHGDLKKTYYDSTLTDTACREEYGRQSGKVEAFVTSAPADTASRATALAVMGWMQFLGKDADAAFATFAEARALDGEVAWGYMFEAMAWLSRYLLGLDFFSTTITASGISYEWRVETGVMREARARFEALAREGDAATVWGEEASEGLRKAMGIFEGFTASNLEELETGLSEAIALPDLVWLEEELLLARAKVRYIHLRIDEGLGDIRELLQRCPNYAEAHLFLGELLVMKGKVESLRGGDPEAPLLEGIAAYEQALAFEPDRSGVHAGLGIALMSLARERLHRGRDEGDLFQRSIRCYDEAIRLAPDRPVAYSNRAAANLSLAERELHRGGDPREHCRLALEDLDRADARDDGSVSTSTNRGAVYATLAMWEYDNDVDPTDHLKAAADCFEKTFQNVPEDREATFNRGMVFMKLGDVEWDADRDPRELFRRALEDFDRVVSWNESHLGSWDARGMVLRKIALAGEEHGEDPRPLLEEAVQSFDEVLARKADHAQALSNAGVALASLGVARAKWGQDPATAYETSLGAFDRALEANPELWQALSNRARLLERMGRFDDALKDYEAARQRVRNAPAAVTGGLARMRAVTALEPWKRAAYFAQKTMSEGGYRIAYALFEKALAAARESRAEEDPEGRTVVVGVHYNLACILSLASAGKPGPSLPGTPPSEDEARASRERALVHLRDALALGYREFAHARNDADLEPLRADPAFEALLAEFEDGAGDGEGDDGR